LLIFNKPHNCAARPVSPYEISKLVIMVVFCTPDPMDSLVPGQDILFKPHCAVNSLLAGAASKYLHPSVYSPLS